MDTRFLRIQLGTFLQKFLQPEACELANFQTRLTAWSAYRWSEDGLRE